MGRAHSERLYTMSASIERPRREDSSVIGIDLGTSSCKVVLIDRAGQVNARSSRRYPTVSPVSGRAEQDPADWLRAAAEAVRAVVERDDVDAGSIAAVGLSSAAHIGVLIDDAGCPVRPAILWNDQRTVAEVAELTRAAGEEILQATCQSVSTGWTLAHLVWIRRHDPDAWQRTRQVLLSKDYLTQWLTGRTVTDPATAVSSQLYDFRIPGWTRSLCELAGIGPDDLPVIENATWTAPLTARAAAELGIPEGIPVAIGTLDSATEMIAAGRVDPGDALIRLATSGGVQIVTDGPQPATNRITYPHPIAPYWYVQAGTNTCGAAVDWAVGALFDGSFEQWEVAAAEAPPGTEGLLFHPYLSGERAPHWDPQLRGSFTGLTLRHDRRHLARAVYEGTAFSIRQALNVLPDPVPEDRAIVVVGGGCRSALWTSIVAAVLDREILVTPDADSAFGAALVGLVGSGLQPDITASVGLRTVGGNVVVPDPRQRDVYSRCYQRYTELHSHIAPFYARDSGHATRKN